MVTYDELLGLLQTRRSVRRFRDEPLRAGTLERLVEAARWAPSASNQQSWRLMAIEDAALRHRLGEAVLEATGRLVTCARAEQRAAVERYAAHFCHFTSAPLVLAPVYREPPSLLERACGPLPELLDPAQPGRDALASAAAALEHVLLAAHALGLGACWMTGPLVAEARLRAHLGVPEGWRLLALVPVGVPAEAPEAPRRREPDALLLRPRAS